MSWPTLFNRSLLAAFLLIAATASAGCDPDKSSGVSDTDKLAQASDGPPTLAWAQPELPSTPTDLRRLDESLRRDLAFEAAEKFPPCHEIFEADGAPLREFPLNDARRRPLILAGCKPEAYRPLDNGTRLIAYALPTGEAEASDLRLVAYGPDGPLMWHARLDRSENAKNFRANFRKSYIAPLLPRLVCFGTLWQGGTQASCVNAKSGELAWAGKMPFWAGVAPQPQGTSLVAAGLNGLTRRYPYSGVEMRAKAFKNTGGRTGFYATDGELLFFSSARAKPLHLTAYHLDDFEPVWALELPDQPLSVPSAAFKDLGILLFKIDETLHAINTRDGRRLWSLKTGSDASPMVAHAGRIYLLLRRDSGPNQLIEIEPKTGAVQWYAPVPTGSLTLLNIEDTLLLRSVRAVREVPLEDASSAAGHADSAEATP